MFFILSSINGVELAESRLVPALAHSRVSDGIWKRSPIPFGKGPMKHSVRVFSLFGTLLLAMALANFANLHQVAAQPSDDIIDGLDEGFDDLAGLQSGVARLFTIDYSAALPGDDPASPPANATPVATPDVSADGITTAIVGVLQFDTEANAIAAVRELGADMQGEDDSTSIDVVGFDGETAAYAFAGSDDEDESSGITIVTQDGDQVVIAMAAGETDDMSDLATDLALDIVSAEPGSGDPSFDAAGASEGGLWDKLPTQVELGLASYWLTHDVEIAPDTND
jgi:hypothetical protein